MINGANLLTGLLTGAALAAYAALQAAPGFGHGFVVLSDVAEFQYKCSDFYSAEDELELLVRRDDELYLYEAERDYAQPLGLTFTHPTFDVDIRRCDNRCTFCFVLQMAPKFRRTLYIKDDDYRYSFLLGNFITLTNLSDEDIKRIISLRLSPVRMSATPSNFIILPTGRDGI